MERNAGLAGQLGGPLEQAPKHRQRDAHVEWRAAREHAELTLDLGEQLGVRDVVAHHRLGERVDEDARNFGILGEGLLFRPGRRFRSRPVHPSKSHFRVVRRQTELAGTQLEPGQRLMLLWGAANRDPEAFERPDDLILDRKRLLGPHVAFGYGYHLCLGAELARVTARTVVTRILERTTSIGLTDAKPVIRPSPYLRTHTSLPLSVTAA